MRWSLNVRVAHPVSSGPSHTVAVLDIAKMDGALGHDAISLLYVERLYRAIVGRAIKPKTKGKKA